jgi:hypothetical protein
VAIILNQEEENKQQPATQPGMQLSSGSSAAPSGAPQPRANPASSGQFTNVQRFLQANRGVGSQIAGRLSDTTGQQVQQATQRVGQVGGLKQDVTKEQERVGQAGQIAEQIRNNVVGLTQNQPQFEQARQLIQGTTAAQQQTQALGDLSARAQSALTQAGQTVAQLGTEPGRFSLLRRTIGAPQYTAGQQRLDQLLTQTEGSPLLTQQSREQRGVVGQQAALASDLQSQISQGIQDYTQAAQAAQQQLTGTIGEVQTGIKSAGQQALEQARSMREQDQDILRRFFAGELADPAVSTPGAMQKAAINPDRQRAIELLQSMGVDPGMRTFGVLGGQSLSQMFQNYGQTPTDIQQVLSEQEIARLNALQRLSGQEPTYQRMEGPGALAFNQELLGQIQAKERELQDFIENYQITFTGNRGGSNFSVDPRTDSVKNLLRAFNSPDYLRSLENAAGQGRVNLDKAIAELNKRGFFSQRVDAGLPTEINRLQNLYKSLGYIDDPYNSRNLSSIGVGGFFENPNSVRVEPIRR